MCFLFTVLSMKAVAQSIGFMTTQFTPSASGTSAQSVGGDLAVLRVKLAQSTFRAHQPIKVTLVLQAGPKGVYLPAYFGDFMATCESGFSAVLLTEEGKAADTGLRGCITSGLHSIDTPEAELSHFVYLKPGESRIWHTNLSTQTIPPGKYRLVAEYLADTYMIHDVAKLPQVHGLMAPGRISAAPVPILIQ